MQTVTIGAELFKHLTKTQRRIIWEARYGNTLNYNPAMIVFWTRRTVIHDLYRCTYTPQRRHIMCKIEQFELWYCGPVQKRKRSKTPQGSNHATQK